MPIGPITINRPGPIIHDFPGGPGTGPISMGDPITSIPPVSTGGGASINNPYGTERRRQNRYGGGNTELRKLLRKRLGYGQTYAASENTANPYSDLEDFSSISYGTGPMISRNPPMTPDEYLGLLRGGRFGAVPYDRVRRMQDTMNQMRKFGYTPGAGRRLRSATAEGDESGVGDAAMMAARMRLR